jgi:hypothetical protein
VGILRAFASSAMLGTRSKMSAADERTAADGGKDDTDGVPLFFMKTQKALRFDALIEKREFLHIYKLRRANTTPNNSTH